MREDDYNDQIIESTSKLDHQGFAFRFKEFRLPPLSSKEVINIFFFFLAYNIYFC